MQKRKNIILLTIECLRKDFVSVYNYEEHNTPNLHKIARKSLIYDNFYSSSSWTPPSFYAIFTSNYPLMDEGRVSLNKYDITFTEILRKNGYYTIGLTTGGWLSKYFGFDKGFIKFYDGSSRKQAKSPRFKLKEFIKNSEILGEPVRYLYFYKKYYWHRRGYSDELNSRALEWLNNLSGKPLFLWIHYPETHEPYYPPRQMTIYRFNEIWRLNKKIMKDIGTRKRGALKLSPKEKEMLLNLYRSELKYVDEKIGDLMEKLDDIGYLNEDTYVFIMGDHGQQFLEHGDFGHGVYLYEELCNVPLLIYNENFKEKKERTFVSGIDIGPTILDIANIPYPESFLGTSIFTANSNREIILQEGRNKRNDFIIKGNNIYLDIRKYKIALIENSYKYIMTCAQDELYNLKKDPKEKNNLIDIETEIYISLSKRLKKCLKQIHKADLKQRIKRLKLREYEKDIKK